MELKEIQGFDSPGHFESFCKSLDKWVADGFMTRIPVEKIYGPKMFNEEWYLSSDREVWRLVEPDYPFKGVFELVRSEIE